MKILHVYDLEDELESSVNDIIVSAGLDPQKIANEMVEDGETSSAIFTDAGTIGCDLVEVESVSEDFVKFLNLEILYPNTEQRIFIV